MNGDNYWTRQRRVISRRGILGSAAGAAALALAGCGDDDDKPKTAAATAPAGTTPVAGSSATAPAPAAPTKAPDFFSTLSDNPPDPIQEKDYKTGGKALRLTNRPIDGFDTLTGSRSAAGETAGPAYSKLVRLASRANMPSTSESVIEADIATAWEQPDASTLVFTLTPDVKFQNVAPLNGRPFTIDDIKYTFNRGKQHAKSLYKSEYSIFESIDDVGGGKVRIKLSRPFAPALQLLGWVPFALMPRELGDADRLSTAAGTGPFIIQKATPNVEIVYVKNPDYFKKDSAGRQRPYLDGYTLSFVADDAARRAQIEAGKVDSAYLQSQALTMDNAEDLVKKNPQITIQKLKNPVPSWRIGGHAAVAPWNDKRVRIALSMVMNYDVIASTIQKGQSMTGPFFPWSFLSKQAPTVAELGPNFKFDPAEAKKLLAAAGFANGLELQLDWYVAADIESQVQLIQQSAAQAGIKLNLVKSPDVVTHGNKQSSKQWPGLIILSGSLSYIDPVAATSVFQPGNSLNPGEINDPELTALAAKLESTTGPERLAAGRSFYENLKANMWEVPLPYADDLTFWSSRLHNFRETAWYANAGIGAGNNDQIWVSS